MLRPGVRFHDGTPLTAQIVREFLVHELPQALGPSYADVAGIEAQSPNELTIVLKRRSAFLAEALNILIHPIGSSTGTGPFIEVSPSPTAIELRANEAYYGGRPFIDKIVIERFSSVRSAWAEMLRGQVDMVYEVGSDAFDLMRDSTGTSLFPYERPYSFVVVLNVQRPALRDAAIRRALNAAINRDVLVSTGLDGHGRIADGPLWPNNWANDRSAPRFEYQPSNPAPKDKPLTFTCLYSDPSYERIALLIRQQLRDVGIDVELELTSVADGFSRAEAGDFDAWLADVGLGPSFFRQYLFWHSGSPYNWGRYNNVRVDTALDAVRDARNDDEYRTGVAAFQRAIVDDPPAIFLAWSERARAVSTRFDVHVEPGRDVLNTLRLWRPLTEPKATSHN